MNLNKNVQLEQKSNWLFFIKKMLCYEHLSDLSLRHVRRYV